MDWESLFKRYVWSDTKTPYFFRAARLNRTQARYELFTYTLFVGVLFGVVAIASLSDRLPHGNAAIVPIYAFTVVCAAILLGLTRHPWAAFYCAGAPIAALGYFAAYGFHPNLAALDKVVLTAVVLAWLAYAARTVTIARNYPSLPEAPSGV
jgi:hypothetical protein